MQTYFRPLSNLDLYYTIRRLPKRVLHREMRRVRSLDSFVHQSTELTQLKLRKCIAFHHYASVFNPNWSNYSDYMSITQQLGLHSEKVIALSSSQQEPMKGGLKGVVLYSISDRLTFLKLTLN